MKSRIVSRTREDGWIDLIDQDSGRVLLSVQLPAGGCTRAEMLRVMKQLESMTKERLN